MAKQNVAKIQPGRGSNPKLLQSCGMTQPAYNHKRYHNVFDIDK